ncbi:unnamed protein product [Danaus chrysippus]|uniref:Lipase n=1 Tax=Danaus chrysippus TaxID=151541 RepID=A0A8J2R1F8_9NEOP|nr:unnamed protein product [Danaus chrysippus]
MLGVILLVSTVVCAQAVPLDVVHGVDETQSVRRQQFNNGLRIARDGYYSESHLVTTSDGYILELVRIPNKRFQFWLNPFARKKPVVFLMHGLQGSSVSYITLGARRSLAYNLADAGFDVWMGNARGVINSRNHVSLNPDDPKDAKKFFDYSFEDIATKDLPTMIDYVLQRTKQDKLHYVGHSQGGTAFLVLNSLLPKYNDKFISADILAGVGYQDHFPTAILKSIAKATDFIYNFAVRRGLLEVGFRLKQQIVDENLNFEDSDVLSSNNEVALILQSLRSFLEGLLMLGRLEVLGEASVKQFAHYGQNIKDKSFRRWDYGPVQNLLKYGRFQPPQYDLRRVTVDLTMHYAMSDILLSEKDVLNMAAVIPNAKVRKVARESFGHMDFIISNDSKELVTDFVVNGLKKRYE